MDGDAVKRQRELREIANARLLESLQWLCNPSSTYEGTLYSLSVKGRDPRNTSFLAIGKRWTQEEWQITFHEADTPDQAILGIIRRITDDSAKWHRDKYASKDEE